MSNANKPKAKKKARTESPGLLSFVGERTPIRDDRRHRHLEDGHRAGADADADYCRQLPPLDEVRLQAHLL